MHITEKRLAAVRDLLSMLGEDPEREGLIDTPKRLLKAWKDLTRGYDENPADLLSKRFTMDDTDTTGTTTYSGLVMLRDIEVYSTCEHHLLPFMGRAHVGYIPGEDGRVFGISKLARLVDVYARRLQCQERLTTQIADALVKHGGAQGAIVIIDAAHMCMRMRGVSKQNSSMITSEVRGILYHDKEARAEALTLLGG